MGPILVIFGRNPVGGAEPLSGRGTSEPAVSMPDLDWRLIPEESRSGAMNMALDEAAARSVAGGAQPVLRLYRWQPSTLSLGYHQDERTVDWARCRETGVDVTRRPTGGGGIYHDRWGDISYSIIVPTSAVAGDLTASYRTLLTPIIQAFDRMGLEAKFSDRERPGLWEPACYLRPVDPAHDVVADDRKISGNAQYRQRDVIIQHGSITYESDPRRHLSVFADPDATPEDFGERVTDVRSQASITRAGAVSALESSLREWASASGGRWSRDELRTARELAETKYRSTDWTRRGKDPTA